MMFARLFALLVLSSACLSATAPAYGDALYQTDLVAYPGQWGFMPRASIILVSDEELKTLAADPDAKLNLTLGHAPNEESLREICERAQAAGWRTLILAFDQFFAQYRPGQDKPRELTPDMPEYVALIAKIGAFAQQYGLGLELSLLSPLEIGPAYQRQTGETGRWMHYRKGLRDPKTGAYSVQLWRQTLWGNNKGNIEPQDDGVRVFAFREEKLGGSPYRYVNPEKIVEITDTAQVDVWDGSRTKQAVRVRVYGEGHADIGDLDRVLVVQQYRTPEMDYFSPNALPYLTALVDQYADAGVELNGLYADEMHIQQDWGYFNHHDHGEFALRYVSDGLINAYAERYGEEYRDFAKYLVYFVRGQEDFAHDLSAKDGVMHVFDARPQGIRQTALFRARYYKLLQNGVVDLFTAAKKHAEERMGRPLESRAHATWAESPTIDKWDTGRQPQQPNQYEYTSNFVWSCTVHQAASACYDYFKWGDFLTGNGNDHAEGGWLDRNYFALALGCSMGVINDVPYSYAAHWGVPGPVGQARSNLVNAYGTAGSPLFGLVQDMEHRDVNVLMLYPLDLVAVDERFGSWMTQYGYANYLTAAKLLELGRVVDGGAIDVRSRRYTTVCALFEPFPSDQLLAMLRQFVEGGGKLVWSGPPPVVSFEGGDALGPWQELMGVDYTPGHDEGLLVPGRVVEFQGPLAGVAPQTILTDFLVDRIYPVVAREGTAVAAMVNTHVVGAHRAVGAGSATVLGYRPRDDQAASLGYETRNWFEILAAVGAYPATGVFPGVNDNTEYLSRTTDFLTCRFPNGTTTITKHFRDYVEGWPGGFSRTEEEDKRILEERPLPNDALVLDGFKVNGHEVSYNGRQTVAFRTNEAGELIALAGSGANAITIDGRTFTFADAPLPAIAWAPVPDLRRVDGGAILQVMVHGGGTVRIPKGVLPDTLKVFVEGPQPGTCGNELATRWEEGALVLEITGNESGRWLWVTP